MPTISSRRYGEWGIKLSKKRIKHPGFFTLTRQYSLVSISGIVLSCIIVNLVLLFLGPLLNINTSAENAFNQMSKINKELYRISEDPEWSIGEGGKVPEIDEVIQKYKDYDIKYEIYPDVNLETFWVEGKINESVVDEESIGTIVLEANNGVVVVGINALELIRIALFAGVFVVISFIVVYITIVSIFGSRKVRYLKTIAHNLEYIAGGDLDTKIPLRGSDEIFLVANHINEMTLALKNQMQKEAEVEEMKKQLITNISHDLRTPMTAILGFLDVLNNMDLESNPTKAKEYIQRAYEKSNGLTHLVDQLFDYVLISNQQMTFHMEQVEPSVFFIQAFSEIEHLLEENDIQIIYNLEYSKYLISIDCCQFIRVIENLGQNILKYGRPNSTVTVEGRFEEGQYVINITNESLEPMDDSNDFLSRYFTTDRSSGKSAGLGLAICKEIVEQQKGGFRVEAHQSTFITVIILPCTGENYGNY